MISIRQMLNVHNRCYILFSMSLQGYARVIGLVVFVNFSIAHIPGSFVDVRQHANGGLSNLVKRAETLMPDLCVLPRSYLSTKTGPIGGERYRLLVAIFHNSIGSSAGAGVVIMMWFVEEVITVWWGRMKISAWKLITGLQAKWWW